MHHVLADMTTVGAREEYYSSVGINVNAYNYREI